MSDFNIRSDSVNVEEIMQQIRARIREKRGVDYTEQEIRELANVKLQQFLDPSRVRSELLQEYQQLQRRQRQAPEDAPLDEASLFGSPRPWVRRARRWLRPVLKLFINPAPLMRVLPRVNDTMARQNELFYELIHNLVVETTRLSIEVKNLKMRVESVSSRLDFDERRARALEGTVQYRPQAPQPPPAETAAPGARRDQEDEGGEAPSRSRRRRRRRGRRGGGPPTAGVEENAAQGVAQADQAAVAVSGDVTSTPEPPAPASSREGAPDDGRVALPERDDEEPGS